MSIFLKESVLLRKAKKFEIFINYIIIYVVAIIMKYKLVISVVSHNQMQLVNKLLKSLDDLNLDNTKIILRSNTFEDVPIISTSLKLEHIKNLTVKGFAENHNANYNIYECDYFVVINPDVLIHDHETFNKMILFSHNNNNQHILCPSIKRLNGELEVSARYFPSLTIMLKKILFGKRGAFKVLSKSKPAFVDWAGGMFHFFPSEIFLKLGGYDEKYFLYYEDVDICYRAKQSKINTCILPDVLITHEGQRNSHKSFYYFLIHIKSLLRFWTKFYFR